MTRSDVRGFRSVRSALIVCVLCTTSVGCDWPWRHDMADAPSPAAAQGPRPPATGTLPLAARGPTTPDAGESVESPFPQRDPAAVESGRALYGIYCAPCHGASGSGVDAPVAKYFPRVGDLTSSAVQQHGDGWLYGVVTAGVGAMPAYGHELGWRERWQVVQFVRTMSR